MTIDRTRSWAQQGLYHPAAWGASIPDEWTNAEVSFYRSGELVDNGIGGFEPSGGKKTVLVTRAHVELDTDTGMAIDAGLGDTQRRYYTIIIATPAASALPRKGDRVSFSDPLGRTIDLSLEKVDLPEGSADHVEIQTEEFE